MAFVKLADYLAYANIPELPENQIQIETALTKACAEVERITQRDFDDTASPIDEVEIFDGNGSFRYFTKQAPILTVTSIEWWDATNWNDVDDYNMSYTTDLTNGEVSFDARYKFHAGQENWRITYTYNADAPEDIKTAALMIAQHMINLGKFSGLSSQADGEQSFGYDLKIPQVALDICARYRRF